MKCAHDIKNVIQYETPGEVACFIGEPIQGVGGAVTPPKEFFRSSTTSSASMVAFASPTRCKPASDARATTTGAIRTGT